MPAHFFRACRRRSEEYEKWRPFCTTRRCEVKHGVRISVVNLYEIIGNRSCRDFERSETGSRALG